MSVQVGDDRRALAPWRTPGEFLTAVAQAETAIAEHRSQQIDPRLRWSAAAGSDEQGVYSDPHGGFFVPTTHAPFSLSVGAGDDPAEGRLQPVPMTSPTVHIGARVDKNHTTSVSGGLRFYRHPETVTAESSRMEMERITLDSPELIGLAFASEHLVVDSFPSLAAVLEAGYREESRAVLLEERLWGTGTGESLGIMRSPALIAVGKESGQAADTVVGANLISMRARCWGYRRAVWLATFDAIPQLMTAHVALDGGIGQIPAWQPGGSEGDGPDWLLGRPLFYSDRCAALGDQGDIVLVDWSQVLDGVYQPFSGMDSMHVRFSSVTRAFRFMMRGMSIPWWRAALTPKRGANTLSPYVTLAERS